ncbi:MAG: hypothetical protein NTZ80_00355 [Patescibacteria group bacterium]|nr:hypothetical protein [Patescibacteria group bacterium]
MASKNDICFEWYVGLVQAIIDGKLSSYNNIVLLGNPKRGITNALCEIYDELEEKEGYDATSEIKLIEKCLLEINQETQLLRIIHEQIAA